MEKVLSKNVGIPQAQRMDVYIAHGGYQAVRKALLELKPQELIEMVKKSGLRGRGGAGFPTGLKWDFMPKDPNLTKYLCINFDEGEPGTFKDRYLVENDPHQVLEGAIIAAYAGGVSRAYVYTRGEFSLGIERWKQAIAEAYEHGLLGDDILGTGFSLDVSVHRGAGAYVCGEETALMESVEGKRGEPRLKPPFPTQAGLFGQPTLINNVETLACVPHIVLRGPEWFAEIGTDKSKGPKLFCVSGHVEKPGNYVAADGSQSAGDNLRARGGGQGWPKAEGSHPWRHFHPHAHPRASGRADGFRDLAGGGLHAWHGGGHRHRRDHLHRERRAAHGQVLRS